MSGELSCRIASFQNILTNKVSYEISTHYSKPVDEPAKLWDVYIESFCMEFGSENLQWTGVRDTLVALAVSTSAFIHMSYDSDESVDEKCKQAKMCVTCQLYNFGKLFPSLIDDSDSD